MLAGKNIEKHRKVGKIHNQKGGSEQVFVYLGTYENGILSFNVPKEQEKIEPKSKYIAIEG